LLDVLPAEIAALTTAPRKELDIEVLVESADMGVARQA
jgi:hypothetical protein